MKCLGCTTWRTQYNPHGIERVFKSFSYYSDISSNPLIVNSISSALRLQLLTENVIALFFTTTRKTQLLRRSNFLYFFSLSHTV